MHGSSVASDLIRHLGRVADGDGRHGLSGSQWAVLRYVARANRFSRAPSAVASYHGTTRGTASQVIKSLVARGFLSQTRSHADRRRVRLDLTQPGQTLIDEADADVLTQAVGALPAVTRQSLAETLQRLQCAVAARTGKPLFGTCATCAHLDDGGDSGSSAAPLRCRFVNATLNEGERDALCINYAPGAPAPNGT